eukprot:1141820-Pelagomonas_calceolata.AAC.4
MRGGRHFRHPQAPSLNTIHPPDTDEHSSVGALAQDAPDWWGWGGGGLVGGVAPNSSASSSYVRKRTGILSGGDAWQRFTRTQSGMGSSDSESEVESHRIMYGCHVASCGIHPAACILLADPRKKEERSQIIAAILHAHTRKHACTHAGLRHSAANMRAKVHPFGVGAICTSKQLSSNAEDMTGTSTVPHDQCTEFGRSSLIYEVLDCDVMSLGVYTRSMAFKNVAVEHLVRIS